MYNKLEFFRKFAIALIILIGFIGSAYSQTKPIDSLQNLLTQKEGADKTKILLELAREHNIEGLYEKAIEYSDRALELASQNKDSLNIVMAYRFKGVSFRKQEKFEDALALINKALPVARRNNFISEVKFLLSAMGIIYTNKAQYDRALDCNFQSLVIREAEGDQSEISISLNNIGFVYFKLKNYKNALDYFTRSLKIRRETGDMYAVETTLINIGLSEVHLGDYIEAVDHFREGFSICGDNCSDEVKIEGEFGLGVAYYNLKKIDVSKEHFNSSYQLAKKTENQRFQSENKVYLGRISMKEGNLLEAEKSLKESETIASESGYNQLLLDVYKESFKLYSLRKNIEREVLYQRKYIELKDSLISVDLVNHIAMIQAGFEERQNIKTIREQDEVLKLKEVVISKVRAQYFFILTITILSILLTFVFVRFNRIQQRTNVELTRAKREIESKNQVLELTNAELDARVNERTEELKQSNKSLQHVNDELDNFIYKTSHDIRGPLASLKGITNVAMLDVKDTLALDYLKKLDSSAEKLNTILTRLVIVNHINHATLNPERIVFREMIDDILVLEKKKGIPHRMIISCDIQQEVHLISDKGVLRLAVENLIDNAIKFYSDSERLDPFVKIEIRRSEADLVEINVIDNGIGIQEDDQQKLFQMFMRASERSETGGIGLYLAKLATEKVAGQISFTALENKLTCFSISLPADLNKVLDKRKQDEQQRMS